MLTSRLGLSAATMAACLTFATPVSAEPEPFREVKFNLDSGAAANYGHEPRVVWTGLVEAPESHWVRVFFDTADLAVDPETGESAVLRITSLWDGANQHLDALNMRRWQDTSAYFNGDSVVLELIAPPNGLESRVSVDVVHAGIPVGIPESICGATDDRIPSSDPRVGRSVDGCTHWLIHDQHHCLISAGHCSGTFTVIEFNYPLSDPNGNAVRADPEDQYPVDRGSIHAVGGGIGNDWGYYGLHPNSETGLTAWQKQGVAFDLMEPPAVNGQDIRITGNGVTSWPIDPTWNRAQKTHIGPYYSFSGSTLRYQTDTTGGNSGSPVILEPDDVAIGVHTHAGCDSGGGANHGTGFNNISWQNAMDAPRGICSQFNLNGAVLIAGQNTTISATGISAGETVYFVYSTSGLGETPVDALGVTLGLRSPTLGGSAVADSGGVAQISPFVPAFAQGYRVWMQAAHVGRTSTINSTVVQ